MKEKKIKYVDDLLEEYIRLTDQRNEIPILIQKAQQKHDSFIAEQTGTALKHGDAEYAYKIFLQIRKYQEQQGKLQTEIKEVESVLKDFLQFLNGNKISYKKRDDNDKSKITFFFWFENGQIKTNRQV